MGDYLICDMRSRKTVALCVSTAIALFVVGIVIGYFASRKGGNTDKSAVDGARYSMCSSETITSPEVIPYVKRYVERHSLKHACVTKPSGCLDFDLPRNYIAYHLNGKKINIDGQLDDAAWNEVPWSETFVDIRSSVYPKPYLDTKFKLRWDDDRLYVAAYIQETDLWATLDTHDDKLHYENNFEVFMDVDGTLFNYKQVQINVLGTMMDQVLFMSPHDAADRAANSVKTWHAQIQHAVYTDGTVNRPGDTDRYWSVEMSLTFAALSEYSNRAQSSPIENETWFMQFGRAEYRLNVTDGKYVKPKSSKPDWWSWQPCDAVNLQLQDRWGLVQFKRNTADRRFSFPKWHVYKSLFDTHKALKTYIAVNGKKTTRIDELDIPPYLLSGTCVEIPKITVSKSGFVVSVESKLLPNLVGSITEDRYVTFD